MRFSDRDRVTLLVYGLIFGVLLVAVGVASRDVLFERFTARRGAAVVPGQDTLFVIGGQDSDGDVYRSILEVDPRRERIALAGELDAPLVGFSAVSFADSVYILGGMSDREYTDGIVRYDAVTERVVQVGRLPLRVAFGAAVAVDGVIYHLGGFDGTERRDEIIAFDPSSGSAAVVAELPQPRDNHRAVVASGSIFVLGGDGPNNSRYSDIVELAPVSGAVAHRWALPQQMNSLSATVHDGVLYALGSVRGNRDALVSLVVDGRSEEIVRSRPIGVDARSVSIASAGAELLAIGGAHPTVVRQLGVFRVWPDRHDAETLRFHSRVWY